VLRELSAQSKDPYSEHVLEFVGDSHSDEKPKRMALCGCKGSFDSASAFAKRTHMLRSG
jgi:hypothetical protein